MQQRKGCETSLEAKTSIVLRSQRTQLPTTCSVGLFSACGCSTHARSCILTHHWDGLRPAACFRTRSSPWRSTTLCFLDEIWKLTVSGCVCSWSRIGHGGECMKGNIHGGPWRVLQGERLAVFLRGNFPVARGGISGGSCQGWRCSCRGEWRMGCLGAAGGQWQKGWGVRVCATSPRCAQAPGVRQEAVSCRRNEADVVLGRGTLQNTARRAQKAIRTCARAGREAGGGLLVVAPPAEGALVGLPGAPGDVHAVERPLRPEAADVPHLATLAALFALSRRGAAWGGALRAVARPPRPLAPPRPPANPPEPSGIHSHAPDL